jgi:hypothetical protein
MQAIEFKTTLQNGTVMIPIEYSSQWEGKTIRVIFLTDTDDELEKSVNQESPVESLFSRLQKIKISAPADFSENLDAYLSGEKNV